MIALSFAGFAFGEEAVRGQLEYQLDDLMGSRSADMVEQLVANSAKRSDSSWAAIAGMAALVFGATGVFGQLKDSLNTIWEVEIKSETAILSFLKARCLSFSMVLVIGFLLLVSMLLTTALQAFSDIIGEHLPFSALVWQGVSASASMVIIAILFAMIFKILPDVKTRWSDVWVGAVMTAVLFAIGKQGIGIYLGREETVSAYGAAGALVMVLLWVYFASVILLYGAEFTKAWTLDHRATLAPSANAKPLTSQKLRKQGVVGEEELDGSC